MGMIIQLEGEGTLNQRLYRGLTSAIVDGRTPPGTCLPSTRALADQVGVSRNVVLKVFEELRGEGYLEARIGSGTFVARRLPEIPARLRQQPIPTVSVPETRLSEHAQRVIAVRPLPAYGSNRAGRGLPYDFRYSLSAAEDFPHAIWSRLVTRRARSLSIRSLWYGRSLGYAPLREAIAAHVRRSRGVVAVAEQVVIVNGTQQGLDIVARMLLDRGDRVVIEEPGYLAARQVFQAYGARLVPVPADADGLDTSQLPRRGAVRLAFVTPSHQFPLGSVMPIARRLELLRWAEEHSAHILEDDYDCEFRYRGRPLESVQGLDRTGRVLYLGTFSKVLFPSLRIGYLVLPPALVPAFAAIKYLSDIHTPTFEQEVLADFITEGHFERHLRRTSARNAVRRATLLQCLEESFGDGIEIVGAHAGIHVVVWLNDVSARQLPDLVARAARHGVGIYSVAPYYLRPTRRAGLLLGYTCLQEREIRAGVRALARALPTASV